MHHTEIKESKLIRKENGTFPFKHKGKKNRPSINFESITTPIKTEIAQEPSRIRKK